MRTKIKWEPVPGQIEKVLKSQAMVNHLGTIAADIRDRCGKGYESEAQLGRLKGLAMVWPDTWEAKKENARRHVMVRAAGRRV